MRKKLLTLFIALLLAASNFIYIKADGYGDFVKPVKAGELTFWNVWGNIAINKDATAEDLANVESFDVLFEADAIQAEGFADAAAAFAAFDAK